MRDCPLDTTWVVNIRSVRDNHAGCETASSPDGFACWDHGVDYMLDEHGRWVVHPLHRRYAPVTGGAA